MPNRMKATEAGISTRPTWRCSGVFDQLKADGKSPADHDIVASRVIANYIAGIRADRTCVAVKAALWTVKARTYCGD